MDELVRDGKGRDGRGQELLKASESFHIIPIAKETTSQFPASISAPNSCFAYNLASPKDFSC